MRVLFDADAYIAIYGHEDSSHAKAMELLEKTGTSETFTTWDVIDEVTTKLSYKISKAAAEKFLFDLAVSETVIIYSNEDLMGRVVETFNAMRSKNVSFTDCSNIVIYEDYFIDRIFSFDKIYAKQGLKLLS